MKEIIFALRRPLCRIVAISLFIALWMGPESNRAAQGKEPVEYANPLVGTAPLDDPKLIGNAPPPGEELYTGFTEPGPALPHRSVNLGPINKDIPEAAHNHGIIWSYTHPRHTMIGFSSPEPGLTIMPLVGNWTVPPDRSYASAYDKDTEKASPGYYAVTFPDYGIRVELTTTEQTGLYRFTFPKTSRGVVLIDMGPDNASVEIVGDQEVRGVKSGWGGRGRGGQYFVAKFSKPFEAFGTFRQNLPRVRGGRVQRDDVTDPGSRSETGSYAGCYLSYATSQGEQVLVKIASGSSFEDAENQLESENPGWDFDGVKSAAEDAWRAKLDLIQVEGGTEKERGLFYSALYHALGSPRLVAKKGEEVRERNGTTHVLESDRYSGVPFWDTGRNQIVLLTLIEPKLKEDVLRSEYDRARGWGFMNTSFHGDNAVFMFLGDWERGLKFDWADVYPYLRKNAMDPSGPRGNLAEYLEKGWIHDEVVDHPSPPYAGGNAGVDKTLEYSWDDYAMALYAKKLGKEDDYKMFLARAHNYTNVFDPSVGFMRGRNADGSWISPFDPREPYYNFMMKEASGWQNLWLVPHDVRA